MSEVLLEAVSSETTDEAPVGFAAKYFTMANGKSIKQEIADSMMYLMGKMLTTKALGDIMDTYETHKNCQEMIVPRVNLPIWVSLKQHARNTDLRLQKMQRKLDETHHCNNTRSSESDQG